MIKASALFYSLVVSLIIAVVCSSFILFSYFSLHEYQQLNCRDQLKINVNSGLTYLQNNTTLTTNNEIEIDLDKQNIGTLIVNKKQWGFYQIFESTSYLNNQIQKKFALVGNKIDQRNSFALHLKGSDKALAIAGNCKVTGNCYMPKVGYKKEKLFGEYFSFDNFIEGETFDNNTCPYFLNENQIEEIKEILLLNNFNLSDSVITIETPNIVDSINNSFYSKKLILYSVNKIELDNSYITGNVFVVSKNEIVVSNNSYLKDVILMAPKIKFNENLRVTIQAFASDSIILEENVTLDYPSTLGVFNKKESINPSAIKLSQSDTVIGNVCGFVSNTNLINQIGITIPKSAVVIGDVYTNGFLDLQGKVLGTVITDKFLVNSNNSVFENYLYNGTINSKNIPAHFVASSVINRKTKMGIIKWLN